MADPHPACSDRAYEEYRIPSCQFTFTASPELRLRQNREIVLKSPSGRKEGCFPWAELPSELRNAVYDLTIAPPPGPIHILYATEYKSPKACCTLRGDWKPEVNLLPVNKTTYREAAPIFFRDGFRFDEPTTLDRFLNMLSKEQRSWIEHIEIDSEQLGFFIFPTMYQLLDATNLKRVEISCLFFSSACSTGEAAARELYFHWHCHGWLREWGRSKGNVRAGADIIRLTGAFLSVCAKHRRDSTRNKKRLDAMVSEEAEIFRMALGDLLEEAGS